MASDSDSPASTECTRNCCICPNGCLDGHSVPFRPIDNRICYQSGVSYGFCPASCEEYKRFYMPNALFNSVYPACRPTIHTSRVKR